MARAMTEPCDRCVYVEEAEETETILWRVKAERDAQAARVAELQDALRALFRFASSQHREVYAGNVTTREWEDMRSRVKAALFDG